MNSSRCLIDKNRQLMIYDLAVLHYGTNNKKKNVLERHWLKKQFQPNVRTVSRPKGESKFVFQFRLYKPICKWMQLSVYTNRGQHLHIAELKFEGNGLTTRKVKRMPLNILSWNTCILFIYFLKIIYLHILMKIFQWNQSITAQNTNICQHMCQSW